MDREGLLKELVKEKYGSILKFSKETGIPESSIRNIFSRGMDSVNAGTLVDICKNLNVDLESLMDGALSVRPNIQKDMVWKDYVEKAPAQEGERQITEEELKLQAAAYWGGGEELSKEELDTLWEDAKSYFRFKMQEMKKEERNSKH